MKPIIIIPPNVVADEGVKALNDNGICVVVATDPNMVKFLDPIPASSSRTEMENAAIRLSRRVLSAPADQRYSGCGKDWVKVFVELLVSGTSLDPGGTIEEQERSIFNQAKRDELCRLAREEAKQERAKKKQEALKR